MTKTAILAGAVLLLAASALPAPAATQAPVVVELFTSQGCSSCPPADAYLDELAKQPGIVALGFHVDYWDYIGWKDPFASAQSTERQRRYTETLGNRYLYTPEMVIDGRQDATGSDRATVGTLIAAQAKAGGKLPIAVKETAAAKYMIGLPASSHGAGATVWMALFDKEHTTPVARGENEGRTLREVNVVREFRKIGRYDGKATEIAVDMALTRANGCAILVQADHRPGDGQGAILGATLFSEN